MSVFLLLPFFSSVNKDLYVSYRYRDVLLVDQNVFKARSGKRGGSSNPPLLTLSTSLKVGDSSNKNTVYTIKNTSASVTRKVFDI